MAAAERIFYIIVLIVTFYILVAGNPLNFLKRKGIQDEAHKNFSAWFRDNINWIVGKSSVYCSYKIIDLTHVIALYRLEEIKILSNIILKTYSQTNEHVIFVVDDPLKFLAAVSLCSTLEEGYDIVEELFPNINALDYYFETQEEKQEWLRKQILQQLEVN